ncbi:MAG: hypothetical protein QOJ65_404 [Fimbriimonadaceae bacterium]|jgi:SAM-dependent methyltransferase|nr:hypothetical protein [Fimbriimonadaceae bacterium]
MTAPAGPTANLHLVAAITEGIEKFAGLPTLQHEYDVIESRGNQTYIYGWAIDPDRQWTRADLYLNGELVASCEPHEREDVTSALPQFKFGRMSGFNFGSEDADVGNGHTDRADLVFYDGDQPIATVFTPVRTDLETFVPLPPEHLMKRVIGSGDPTQFKRFALYCFGQYLAAANRHREFSGIKKMLDWGCGCGRVTAHYLRIGNGPEVYGCDIDGEDIAWCKANLADGVFETTSPFVPLPYEAGSFDLVVSLSVLTHLSKDQQADWLREIDRVLAHGGLFIGSVHGYSAALRGGEYLSERLKREPFFDDLSDEILDGIAPKGYYRATFQTPDYTRKAFGKVFDILEYIDRGVGIQDLVVARKKDARAGGVLGWMRGR